MHPDYFIVQDPHNDWLCYGSGTFVPNPRQSCVIDAVQFALAAGLYYSVDVRKHCAAVLSLTVEADASQFARMPTEGGRFGMDCYYARGYLDGVKARASLSEAESSMRLRAGDRLGVLVFSDCKKTCAVVVESAMGSEVTFIGKRGRATVRGTATALQLRYAIERAHERQQRKDSFAEFCAARTALPFAA